MNNKKGSTMATNKKLAAAIALALLVAGCSDNYKVTGPTSEEHNAVSSSEGGASSEEAGISSATIVDSMSSIEDGTSSSSTDTTAVSSSSVAASSSSVAASSSSVAPSSSSDAFNYDSTAASFWDTNTCDPTNGGIFPASATEESVRAAIESGDQAVTSYHDWMQLSFYDVNGDWEYKDFRDNIKGVVISEFPSDSASWYNFGYLLAYNSPRILTCSVFPSKAGIEKGIEIAKTIVDQEYKIKNSWILGP
jgi:uncharacterized protein YegP (UPF0339 family)